MEIFSFSIRLRLRHPQADPDLISENMGRTPSRHWRTGELMRGPEGTERGRTYNDSYWCSEARRGEDSQLLDVLKSDLEDLEKRAEFLKEFCASGGQIICYISWFASARYGGDTIGFSILRRLADLRISLALDVYSAAKEEQPPPAETPERLPQPGKPIE
jgi:hypothetical protein